MKPTSHVATNVLPPLLLEHREELLERAESRGLHNVRVFGSMVRGDYHEGSDVDLLVDAPRGTSALVLCGLSIDAEQLLARAVDVVTERCLYPSMREWVIREAVPL